MKIVIDDNIPYIKGRLEPVADVVYTDQWGFTPEIVKDADAVIIRTRTRCNESLLGGSSVRLVATATIGTDQIDIPWCEGHGITVRNSPGCNAPAVAQYVWSALLRSGFDPAHHTLGLVGCGNVGGIVLEWAQKLGAKVLVSDPPLEEKLRRGEVDSEKRESLSGVEFAPLERVMSEADAVTLHTPLTKFGDHPTHHLIGERELSLMQPNAILVNAARGPVVDFKALKPAVLSGRIRAIVDTWEEEPIVDSELLDRVLFGTFHIAGYSRQGKERATRMVLEAVEDTFGVSVDKSGLTGAYECPSSLSAESIVASYNPLVDTLPLRQDPTSFDTLRRNYNYREETK